MSSDLILATESHAGNYFWSVFWIQANRFPKRTDTRFVLGILGRARQSYGQQSMWICV